MARPRCKRQAQRGWAHQCGPSQRRVPDQCEEKTVGLEEEGTDGRREERNRRVRAETASGANGPAMTGRKGRGDEEGECNLEAVDV